MSENYERMKEDVKDDTKEDNSVDGGESYGSEDLNDP